MISRIWTGVWAAVIVFAALYGQYLTHDEEIEAKIATSISLTWYEQMMVAAYTFKPWTFIGLSVFAVGVMIVLKLDEEDALREQFPHEEGH